jgi:hypothetical protein
MEANKCTAEEERQKERKKSKELRCCPVPTYVTSFDDHFQVTSLINPVAKSPPIQKEIKRQPWPLRFIKGRRHK